MTRWALATALVVAACSPGEAACETIDPGGPIPFHLYVSNQSFDVDPVDIAVSIDDVPVICQDFEVEGQHNWVLFELGLDPGHHHITASGNHGATTFQEEFDHDGERWAVLDFWHDPDDGFEEFSFSIHD
ncbi:MAG: hypothetical protein WAL25_10870, partial [Acidimicrobiia bacterium]